MSLYEKYINKDTKIEGKGFQKGFGLHVISSFQSFLNVFAKSFFGMYHTKRGIRKSARQSSLKVLVLGFSYGTQCMEHALRNWVLINI